MTKAPPTVARRTVEHVLHGVTRRDDYAWLKADNWQEVMRDPTVLDTAIRAHLEAENAYTESVMSATGDLRERLYAEMRARMPEADDSVPDPDGDFEYFSRYVEGGEHPVELRRARDGAPDEETVLLDGNARAEGHEFFQVRHGDHSPDHRRYGWSVDVHGSEIYELCFRDLERGEDLPDRLPNAQGDFAWAADSATVFYTVLDDNHRPCKVMRHRLGTDPAADVMIYEETDPGFFLGVGLTESRRYVVIDSHDHTTSEVRIIDAHAPASEPILVAPRESGVEYSVSHHGEDLLILTNAGGAEDFKVVRAPVGAGRDAWTDLVPHRAGCLVVAIDVYAAHLVRLETEDGLPRIVVRRLADGAEHPIAFDEEAYSLGLEGGYEFDTTSLRFRYASPTTPARIFDYEMNTRERTLRKEQKVPSGHDPAQYVTRRVHAIAPDAERVPITVLHHRDTPIDGTAPMLLYGYGSYGISIPASFRTSILSLVDRGVVYAIAHVRGGMERGYRWYREGKLATKMNTFTDFVAAAEHLVAERYAAPDRIACHGGSAGGLLVGAAANLRPDLFAAVVGEVPFVDVLNTMCDASLPLTPPEWPEWGNPLESADAYRTIAAYSPYDNVEAKDYPRILATGGLTDPRVTYWEPAKWVAKLRVTKTDAHPVLLKTNMSAGHGGASGRFDRLHETALVFAFVLDVFGLARSA